MTVDIMTSQAIFLSSWRSLWIVWVLWAAPGSCQAQADEQATAEQAVAEQAAAERAFRKQVAPFINSYCIQCHQNKRPTEAGVNFSPALKKPGEAAFSQQWKKALSRVKAHDMPPDYADSQPSDKERQLFMEGLGQIKFLSPKDPGPFVIRRLTKTEYANTLHDLFGVDRSIADDLPDEVSGAGYLNSLSPLQLEQYLAIANKLLAWLISPENATSTSLQQRLFGAPPASPGQEPAAAQTIAQTLAGRIYRRPATAAEVKVLLQVYELGRSQALGHAAALRLMLKAMLVSPQFLFITPAEIPDDESQILPLDDFQLASRLSYLMWATMPDDELLALAGSGRLHQPEVLAGQVKRLLDDPRSRALFDGFGAQWLGVGDLLKRDFAPEKFPQMSSGLRAAMVDEVRLFFESIVRENRSVASFVDSDYTFLNETLAEVYGMANMVQGPHMRWVPLADANRGGILAMPGVLAATSLPNRTSPVKRGVWVLEQVLGEHVPTPPPDVPQLEEQDRQQVANLTLRQRTELHRTDPVCANCHQLLDPIGFGLENFDAIGRWRSQDDAGGMIDAAGELPSGEHFASPGELKRLVAGRVDQLARNLVEKLLAYALCRNLQGYDELVVDELMRTIAADGYRMQTLITHVVTSYPFTHRRIHD